MISVVIPAYNSEGCLADCLTAVQNQQTSQPYEIIVVDDGSTDRTAKIAKQFNIRYIHQANRGPAAARNAGVTQARGENIVFFDADCRPQPDFLEQAQEQMRLTKADALKGFYRTIQNSPVAIFAQAEYEYKYQRLQQYNNIDFVDTYAAVYRRDVLMHEGGFDETFPIASGEDIELSYRLHSRGYVLKAAPSLIVFHLHPDTLRKYFRRKFWVGYWRVKLYAKHIKKMWHDTHTPPSLKLELIFLPILLLSLLIGIIFPPLLLVALIALLGYTATLLSFAVFCFRFNTRLRPYTLYYILARDIAILFGYSKALLDRSRPWDR